jgi:UDP-glucose 4-epimerase
MNVLVVGGAGYIGSLMARRLIDVGHNPVVLDDLSTGNRKAVPDGIAFYDGDLADETLLDAIFRKEEIELAMHFAAKIQVGESVQRPDIYYRNNVAKVINLLGAMLKNGCKSFIFSSSAAVYGRPEYLPVDENHPINPINPYGTTKRMVEIILGDYQRAFGLNSIALRYFNAAGAALDGSIGEAQKEKQNLIPIVLENLEKGRPTTIYGTDWDTSDGTCIRDYIHVEDIVSAHVKAVDYLSGRSVFEIINLGTSRGASVKEVVDMVSNVHGSEVAAVNGSRREGDPAKLVASNEKAKKILGWQPAHSDLETIVRSAHKWHFNRLY